MFAATLLRRTRGLPLRARAVGAGVAGLRTSPRCQHGDFEWKDPATPEEVVRIFVVTRDGERHQLNGKVGDNLLYLTHRWRKQIPELALEGACEASLACSTCHVSLTTLGLRLDRPRHTHACLFISIFSMCPTRMISVQVIVSQEHYDKLPEAEEAEEDMLDLASCLTSTSRLGCQILLSKELEGMEVLFF